jgi:hypothetical protein
MRGGIAAYAGETSSALLPLWFEQKLSKRRIHYEKESEEVEEVEEESKTNPLGFQV